YKTYESVIMGWVVSVSHVCGYKKSFKPGNPDAKKYIIPREQILPRIEQIVKSTKPEVQVPPYVMIYLKKSIADRERCSSWFQEYYAGDASVEDDTDAHIHFTEMLRSMLSMLKTVASKTSGDSQTLGSTRGRPIVRTRNSIHARPRYSELHVEDLETEEEGFGSSDGSSTAVSDDIPDILAGLGGVYEAESTETDRLLAMHELLRKLKTIRIYVGTIWSRYRVQQISLIHATIVTNSAIDCVQSLEDKFSTAFPESPVWGDLIYLLFPEVVAHWQKDFSTLSPENIENMDDIFLAPTALLRTFLDVFDRIDEEWVKTWLPDVNKVYNPRLDVSKLSCHDKVTRNIILLDSMIPEQALHANVEMLSSHNRITNGFKEMLDTKEIRLMMAFSASILCDIHLILGDDVLRPFKDLKLQVERARKEDNGYVQNTDNALMDENRHKLNRNIMKLNDMLVTEDVMMKIRNMAFKRVPTYEYVAHAQKPFFLLSHDPLMCGAEATSIRLRWQHNSILVADTWQHTSAMLHLYSALKAETSLYGVERVFFGSPPTGPQAYKNHYLLILGFSIKWFAANKRKCARTRSKISESKRVRDLRDMRPLLQLLEKEHSWRECSPSPQLADLMEVVQQYHTARHDKKSLTKIHTRRDSVFLDPMVFLSTLSEWLEEEQPRLDFDYYRAHNVCWRLLRRIEASPKIRKKFRKEYGLDVDFEVDQCLKYIPLFIFNRHLEDPNGKWMQSVGETVAKFFRGEPPRNLLPIPPPEHLDDPLDIRYAKGYRMSGDVYHPEKDGKCCHVGVCELQVVHWRLQAGLSPWEEGDEDGSWWKGLRADLRDDETKDDRSHREAPDSKSLTHSVSLEHPVANSHPLAVISTSLALSSPPLPPHITRPPTSTVASGSPLIEAPATITTAEASPPFNIIAEEILAIMPPNGISLMELVTHFSQRIHKDELKDFRKLLTSVSKYDPESKWFTPLK
ncbi:MAG: hypothetical protein Q9213_008430, partial [Squamulea squamosa]